MQSASEVGKSKPSKLPKLEKLDVEKFLDNYRREGLEAGNPPQVVEDLVNHERRMFTDPAYFKRWNAASTQEQEIMIHGSKDIAAAFTTSYAGGLFRVLLDRSHA
jgi:hypothetical protein